MKRRSLQVVLLACSIELLILVSAAAQQKQAMTLNWMFGDTARWVSTPPFHIWLSDGTLLLLDDRKSSSEQLFEVLDPRSGSRRPAFDIQKVLANLKSILPEESLSSLPWPVSIDTAGKHAVYLFGGDV